MLTQLALISELLTIDHGKYVVKVKAQIEGMTIATGLAAADRIEIAEDRARERAMAVVNLEQIKITLPLHQAPVTSEQGSTSDNGKPTLASSGTVETQIHPDETPTELETDSSALNQVHSEPPVTELTQKESRESVNDSSVIESPLFEESELNSEPSLPQPETSPANVWVEDKFPLTSPAYSSHPEPQVSADIPDEVQTPTPSSNSAAEWSPSDTPLDFSDIIARTDLEMKRLGWTQAQGRNYLLQTYGKKSRHVLSDQELIEFLHYLEGQ
jgi:hypothetical protein